MFSLGEKNSVNMKYLSYQIFKNKCVSVPVFMFTRQYPGLVTSPCSCVVLSSDHHSRKFMRISSFKILIQI